MIVDVGSGVGLEGVAVLQFGIVVIGVGAGAGVLFLKYGIDGLGVERRIDMVCLGVLVVVREIVQHGVGAGVLAIEIGFVE